LFLPLESFVRHPHFKPGQSGRPLLFDVQNDIGSTKNVAIDHPEVVKQLTELAEQARRDLGDLGKPGSGQRPPGKVEKPVAQVK